MFFVQSKHENVRILFEFIVVSKDDTIYFVLSVTGENVFSLVLNSFSKTFKTLVKTQQPKSLK